MLRLIKRLALFFIVILPAMAIAVANRQNVELILDPFAPKDPALSISLPMFVYIFAALAIGVILGGIATWFNQSKWRRSTREQSAEARRWRTEADQLKRQIELAEQSALPAPKAADGFH